VLFYYVYNKKQKFYARSSRNILDLVIDFNTVYKFDKNNNIKSITKDDKSDNIVSKKYMTI
jgi:hypothetical protein